MREQEEQEAEDEADGLVDQQMPSKQAGLPGLPGIGPNGAGTAQLPGIGNVAPPPIVPPTAAGAAAVSAAAAAKASSAAPSFPTSRFPNQYQQQQNPALPQNMLAMLQGIQAGGQIPDVSRLAEMFAGGKLPPNLPFPPPGMMPPGGLASGGAGGVNAGSAAINAAQQILLQQQQQQQQQQSFSGNSTVNGSVGTNEGYSGDGPARGSVRKRAPLPSQKESLMEEMKKGRGRAGQ